MTSYSRQVPPLRTVAPGEGYIMSFNYARHPAIIAGEKLVSAVVSALRADGAVLVGDDISFGAPTVAIQGTLLPDGTTAGSQDSILVPFSIPLGAISGTVYGIKCLATTDAVTTPPTVIGLLGRVGVNDPPTRG